MKELTVAAKLSELDRVLLFVDAELNKHGCPEKERIQIAVAVEEIYVNIASYAYTPHEGNATIRFSAKTNPMQFTIQFVDGGKPYNPLSKPDPNVLLNAEERGIGGLGIYIVKKNMDGVRYEYLNGKNIFTIMKTITPECRNESGQSRK